MKKYKVIEKRPSISVWIYEVESESASEALDSVNRSIESMGDGTPNVVEVKYYVETDYANFTPDYEVSEL